MDKVKSCFEFVKSNKPNTDFGTLRCSPNTVFQGETLAMYIFRIWKTDCPEWVRHDPEIINKSGKVAFMVWCEEVKSEPPIWTRVDPLVQVTRVYSEVPTRNDSCNLHDRWLRDHNESTAYGFDSIPLMFWIQHVPQPIPEYLMTKNINLTRDAHGETPLMYWIQFRPNEDIPTSLLHDPLNIRTRDGRTAAMIWIKYRNTLPPESIMHNPYATDDAKDTLAEYWIKYAKDNKVIPESMQYKCRIESLTKIERNWYQLFDDTPELWMSGIRTLIPKHNVSCITSQINTENDLNNELDVMSSALNIMPKVNQLISEMTSIKTELINELNNVRQLEINQLEHSIDNNESIVNSKNNIKRLLNILNITINSTRRDSFGSTILSQ